MKNVEVEVHGLKCDAEGCDYEDLSITSEDYADYVNAPCPKCGANLLTPEDYFSFRALQDLADALNELPLLGGNEDIVTMRAKMNGSGTIELEPEDVQD